MMRIAVVGCGAVTELSHLPAFSSLGSTPTLLVDRDLHRAQAVAREFGVDTAVSSVDEIPDEVDAALVAVPAAYHSDVSVALLERGIHVLVENPLATSVADGEKMLRSADDAGVTLSVGLMRRQFASTLWVKNLLASGELGAIETFCFEEGAVYNWPMETDSGFHANTLREAGPRMDTGSHTLDQLRLWLGENRVATYCDDSYGGVEADCRIELELSNGAAGTVELSRTRILSNSARIAGTRGSNEVDLGENLVAVDPPRLGRRVFDGVCADRLRHQPFEELFRGQLEAWLRTVNGEDDGAVPAREGLETLRIIETCYATRQPMEMPWLRPATDDGRRAC